MQPDGVVIYTIENFDGLFYPHIQEEKILLELQRLSLENGDLEGYSVRRWSYNPETEEYET